MDIKKTLLTIFFATLALIMIVIVLAIAILWIG